MDLSLVDGKCLAVLLMRETASGKEEWAFLEGTASWDGTDLVVDRGQGAEPFVVPEGALERVRPVDETLRGVFERAEFFVPLFMAPLPEGADRSELVDTGLVWPEDDDA